MKLGAKLLKWSIFLAVAYPASLFAESFSASDSRLIAHCVFEDSSVDITGNGHHGVEAGSFLAFNGDLDPLANLLGNDSERGGVYSYTSVEHFYDWENGGDPNNNRLNLEAIKPLPNLPADTGITLMAWIKREAVNIAPNQESRVEFSSVIQIGECGNFPIATLALNAEGQVAGFIEGVGVDDAQVFVEGDTFVTPNEWHHLAICYDRVGDIATTYVDGMPQSSSVDISVVGDGELDWSKALIGSFCTETISFIGEIDDARIYYGALTGEEIAVIVSENSTPQLSGFDVENDFIATVGEGVLLSWDVEGECELSLDPGGVLEAGSESLMVMPTETTMYRLTARNGTASVSRELTVVVDAAPVISSFTVNRTLVRAGAEVEFAFEVSGAASLTIDQQVDVNNPRAVVSETTTYQLTATNVEGMSLATVVVEVTPAESKTYLIDFGSFSFATVRPNRVAEDGFFWNHLFNYRDGSLNALVDVNKEDSEQISLKITDGFDAVIPDAIIADTAFPENAAKDAFSSNLLQSEDGLAELTLENLDATGATAYNFSIFGGLNSAILSNPLLPEGANLMVRYDIIGREVSTLITDAGDNANRIDTLQDVIPAADGTIRIIMRPANALSIGSGINTLQIDALPAPLSIPEIASFERIPIPTLTWFGEFGGQYLVERSTDLVSWDPQPNPLTGNGEPLTWQDLNHTDEFTYYRVRTQREFR